MLSTFARTADNNALNHPYFPTWTLLSIRFVYASGTPRWRIVTVAKLLVAWVKPSNCFGSTVIHSQGRDSEPIVTTGGWTTESATQAYFIDWSTSPATWPAARVVSHDPRGGNWIGTSCTQLVTSPFLKFTSAVMQNRTMIIIIKRKTIT